MQLDLIDSQGNSLLSKEEKTESVNHYLRFETNFMNQKATFTNAFKAIFSRLFRIIPKEAGMKDWTIVDTDDFLGGNPHIDNDPYEDLKR